MFGLEKAKLATLTGHSYLGSHITGVKGDHVISPLVNKEHFDTDSS